MTLPQTPAPDWHVSSWLNTGTPLSLDAFRGKVILALAFQMLCPGCVNQALPQIERARRTFGSKGLAVIGLHTVFEHHEVQGTREALAAFLHEYRIGFPVGIDQTAPDGGIPLTMRRYALQGTPTFLLIDCDGNLRLQHFGHMEDMQLAAAISPLVTTAGRMGESDVGLGNTGCTDENCPAPE